MSDVGDGHFLGGEPESCDCSVREENEGIFCHFVDLVMICFVGSCVYWFFVAASGCLFFVVLCFVVAGGWWPLVAW